MKTILLTAGIGLTFLFCLCGKDRNPVIQDDRIGSGRIPSCVSDSGIDLFVVEGNSVLSLSWNNNTGQTARGGYSIRFGTNELGNLAVSACTSATCEYTLTGLSNMAVYGIRIEGIDSLGAVFAVSCTVNAMPHPLEFLEDKGVAPSANPQSFPCIAGGRTGYPLFAAWVLMGELYLARSDNLGDTWQPAVKLTSMGNSVESPRLTMVDRTADSLDSFLYIVCSAGGSIMTLRGNLFSATSDLVLGLPIIIGNGTNPSIGAWDSQLSLAYESGGSILYAQSLDSGESFTNPVRIDGAVSSQQSHAPSLTLNPGYGHVFVAYHGNRGSADDNVYIVSSLDAGANFGSEVRVDDDPHGGNQRQVSVAVDPRTGVLSATWEDRRQGSDVYFAQSLDSAKTFSASVRTGAGLSGDQFAPRAVIDPGRNTYVLFIDASAGVRPLFCRFNSTGSFDPPLEVSAEAGVAGAAAQEPWVYVDAYGTVFAVWAENRNGAVDNIFFARAE